ncbi:MAG: tetratricopeptide repeat protein [Candidatus Competibacteraceae bacterium]
MGAVAQAQEQKSEDYVQTVTALFQEKTGKAPQPQEIVDVLNRLVIEIFNKGDYHTTIIIAEQTHRFAEQKLGPEHPDILASVNRLAVLYHAQGRYGEAEPLYRRALAVSEKVLGPEHPNTLASVNNLAGLYHAQGRYGEAEPLYRRALAASEKVLGPDHPQTLGSVNNLAGLYQAQGRYGEAEPLYRRALAAREKVLGPDHPDTLASVNGLAVLYQAQGRYGRRNRSCSGRWRRARRRSRPRPPADSGQRQQPRVVISSPRTLRGGGTALAAGAGGAREGAYSTTRTPWPASTTSRCYIKPRDATGKRNCLQRALAASEKVLLSRSPAYSGQCQQPRRVLWLSGTLRGRRNCSCSGRWRRARRYFAPITWTPCAASTTFAISYEAQGRYGEAEPLLSAGAGGAREGTGPDHPDTLASVNGLAVLYQAQGRCWGRRNRSCSGAGGAREGVGLEHPDTLAVQLNYTGTLVNLKQPKRALQLLERMEPRLLELAALQLRHTRQESVRRLFLWKQSNFRMWCSPWP